MDRSTTRPVSLAPPREATRTWGLRPTNWSLSALAARAEAALSIEVLLYAVFVLAAALTRFYDLGSRAQHHDESLHSYFSWQYAEGRGYTHDPMMHGPLLFHLTALSYTLFGASDYTARIPAALFGTILVALPFLLRRQLGRVSMLAASFLLLVSPMMWYYGRFIRQEIWNVALTLLVFIALVRWLDSRRAGWLHVAWVSWVFLYTDKVNSAIVLFIFVTFGVVLFGLAHCRALLAWLPALPAGLLVAMIGLQRPFGWRALPAIPFDNPSFEKSLAYARTMLSSPQVLSALGWSALWLAVAGSLLWRAHIPTQFGSIRDGAPANPLSAAIAWLPRKKLQLGLFVAEFLVIAVPLYTSLFSNFRGGVLSGSFGQIFYWVAQQNVRRGEQPWYYYLTTTPVYEPIPVLLGTLGLLWGAWWLVSHRRRLSDASNMFGVTYVLMAWWAVLTFAIYSFAGEKMPWITVHIALPLVMLGSVWGARALRLEEGWTRSRAAKRSGTGAFVGLAAAVVGWTVYRMAEWSAREQFVGQSPLVYGALALALVAAAAACWLGPRASAKSLGLLGLGVLSAYTLGSAVRLSYVNADIPVEGAIYVQTTPRVPNLMNAIDTVSSETVGGKGARIIYDSKVSWPFVWYLRDYKHARFQDAGPTAAPTGDVQFVLVGDENANKVRPLLANYTEYRYPMRWWFPESMYRQIVPSEKIADKGLFHGAVIQAREIGSRIAAFRKPENQAMLWRYVVYREPSDVLNSTDMVVFVRNDLVGRYNAGRY